jgi:hypothetical protein
MEEHTDAAQLELLAKIHNQLVDLTKLIAEVELSKTNSQELKRKLSQLANTAQHIDTAHATGGSALPRQHQLIAPTDTHITPGEARDEVTKVDES